MHAENTCEGSDTEPVSSECHAHRNTSDRVSHSGSRESFSFTKDTVGFFALLHVIWFNFSLNPLPKWKLLACYSCILADILVEEYLIYYVTEWNASSYRICRCVYLSLDRYYWSERETKIQQLSIQKHKQVQAVTEWHSSVHGQTLWTLQYEWRDYWTLWPMTCAPSQWTWLCSDTTNQWAEWLYCMSI